MARVLIVYGTTEGQTRKIAQRIAAVAEARGHETRLVDSATLSGPLTRGEHDAILAGRLCVEAITRPPSSASSGPTSPS